MYNPTLAVFSTKPLIALGNLLDMDHTLSEVIGIKPGHEATRDNVGAAWHIVEYKEQVMG